MNHLLRGLAPISDEGWKQIDQEARERLEPQLAARRLVDVTGPHGWTYSATNLGRVTELPGGPEGTTGLRRQVLALVELRADFRVARAELQAIDRGADDADFGDLDAAAAQIAKAENAAVLKGWPSAFHGIAERSPTPALALGGEVEGFPRVIATALSTLRSSGVGGPYALALDPQLFQRVSEAAHHRGELLYDHLRQMLGGPIVWTPGVLGGVVISQRGGDFILELGQDLSIGYDSHDGQDVHLYLQESLSFHIATPEAAVGLVAAAEGQG